MATLNLVFLAILSVGINRPEATQTQWSGVIRQGDQNEYFAHLVVNRNESVTNAVISIPGIGVLQTPLKNFTENQGSISFDFEHDDTEIRGELRAEDDDRKMSGQVTVRQTNGESSVLECELGRWPGSDSKKWEHFEGSVSSRFGKLQFELAMVEVNGKWVGTAGLPQLQVIAFPVSQLDRTQDRLTVVVQSERTMRFSGEFDDMGETIRGVLSQGPIELECVLSKQKGESTTGVDAPSGAGRPELAKWSTSSWMVRRHIEPQWALTNVNVVDVVSGELMKNVNLVVRGDVIHSVSKEAVDKSIKAIDGTGRFVIPGLMDLHAHIQPIDLEVGPESEEADRILGALLDHGVTTVRGLPLFSEFASRSASRVIADPTIGPTIIPSSGIFELVPQRTSWGFRDPETARRWVQKEAMLGSRWIKVYNKMDERSLTTIVSAAADHGMFVCGHAEDVPPHVASFAGMRTIEHSTGIPLSCLRDGVAPPPGLSLAERTSWLWENMDEQKADELGELFKQNETGWVPTLVVFEEIADNGGRVGGKRLDVEQVMQLRKANSRAAQYAVALHRKGVMVGLGTDFPIEGLPPGESVHREMELIVSAGGKPLEALQMATVSSAQILDNESIVGTIDEHKVANFVVLKENPLDSISNTRAIEFVVHCGRIRRPRAADQ